ncbi:MAG: RluA family pseudouridine synthase [Polyangiales bacterium]
MTEPRVLHHDAELLVLWKPAGIPTTSPDGQRCLTQLAAALDPRAPRLHASSRLDAPVTGAVTFARTTRAIEALLAARREGRYERLYLALASAAPDPPSGDWRWAIDRDPREPRSRVARGEQDKPSASAASAHTRYALIDRQPSAALLALHPQTGRTHQLRVHAAKAGLPLLGDKPYGGPQQRTLADGRVVRAARVMLHCARVRLPNVAAGPGAEPLTIEAPVPDDFSELWQRLGGDPALLVPSAWPGA